MDASVYILHNHGRGWIFLPYILEIAGTASNRVLLEGYIGVVIKGKYTHIHAHRIQT